MLKIEFLAVFENFCWKIHEVKILKIAKMGWKNFLSKIDHPYLNIWPPPLPFGGYGGPKMGKKCIFGD